MRIKDPIIRAISIGVHPGLSEGKKLAIQIATLDAYWTFLTYSFYLGYAIYNNIYPLVYIVLSFLFFVAVGIWFFYKQSYDIARPLVYLVSTISVYYGVDGAGFNSGFEFYYFTGIAIPFIIYSFEEQWKGNILICLLSAIFVFQYSIGTGHFAEPLPAEPSDKLIAIVFVISYFLVVFSYGRRQLRWAHKEIEKQYNDLIHTSKMAAIGEMAGGIAHEINNPLQTLSLQMVVLKDKVDDPEVSKKFAVMEEIIQKMGKIVSGLKDLSRKDNSKNAEVYSFLNNIEDIKTLCSPKIDEEDIAFSIHGSTDVRVFAHPIQVSQVLINLMNNAIEAIKNTDNKWIKILVEEKQSFLQVSLTDSGSGIPNHVVEKMMEPFFTTKNPSEGTGLGLSISKSLMEKNNGSLYYDVKAPNTTFVILLPSA